MHKRVTAVEKFMVSNVLMQIDKNLDTSDNRRNRDHQRNESARLPLSKIHPECDAPQTSDVLHDIDEGILIILIFRLLLSCTHFYVHSPFYERSFESLCRADSVAMISCLRL
jgi:hypothetical protein